MTAAALTLADALADPAAGPEAVRTRNALVDRYGYAERHIGGWTFIRAKAALLKRKRDAKYVERTAGDVTGEIAAELAAGDRPPCHVELIDLVLFGRWLGEAAASEQPEELCDALGSAVWYLPRSDRREVADLVRAKLRGVYATHRAVLEGRRSAPPEANGHHAGEPAGEQ